MKLIFQIQNGFYKFDCQLNPPLLAIRLKKVKENVQYRKALISDSKKLSVLFSQVYIEAYGIEGVSDEYANFISTEFSVEAIENTIRLNPESIIVAEYKNNLIGVAKIKFLQKCPANNMVTTELNKLYILNRFCGMGIGSKLLEFTEEILRLLGENKMWLWVWDANIRAFKFYEKQNYIWLCDVTFPMEANTYIHKVMLKKIAE
jgi:diamine N-acetyltransferase